MLMVSNHLAPTAFLSRLDIDQAYTTYRLYFKFGTYIAFNYLVTQFRLILLDFRGAIWRRIF